MSLRRGQVLPDHQPVHLHPKHGAGIARLGGELNAEIEHQTARDSTVGSEKPLGRRGAVMADTIGAEKS